MYLLDAILSCGHSVILELGHYTNAVFYLSYLNKKLFFLRNIFLIKHEYRVARFKSGKVRVEFKRSTGEDAFFGQAIKKIFSGSHLHQSSSQQRWTPSRNSTASSQS